MGTPPFPLGATPWVKAGQSQQNLPNDTPPGTRAYSLQTTSDNQIVPFWGDAPQTLDPGNGQLSPWDVVILAGQTLPGICTVTGKRGSRFDIKKSKGLNFATITRQGYDPARIRIVEKIWTPQQLDTLWFLLPLLEAPPATNYQGKLLAVDVYHPALAIRGISRVLIDSIGLLKPTAVRDVWEHEIDLIEYVTPVPKQNQTATANGSLNVAISDSPQNQIRGIPLQPPALPGASMAASTGPQ
jgi:hypothetical protein